MLTLQLSSQRRAPLRGAEADNWTSPGPLGEPRCDRGGEGHRFATGAAVPLRLSAFVGWELCCVYLVSHAPGTFVSGLWVDPGGRQLCFLEPF